MPDEMKKLSLTLTTLLFALLSFMTAKAQTSAQDSLLNQLREVEKLQGWINENLFSNMFDKENPVPMMIYSDKSVFSFNPDSIFLSLLNLQEIGSTPNGELYHISDEANPNFMMMIMGAPYEHGKYEKPWYYSKPWVFCSTYNQTQKLIPGIKDEREWYTMVLHECTHVWQQRHPEMLEALINVEQLYGGPEYLRTIHRQDSTLYAALKMENDALLEALAANNADDENAKIGKFLQFRADRKALMIANGYPEEMVHFLDMQELSEGQTRYIEYNVGVHLGLYEENDARWGDIDIVGWFDATGFNLYNLLKKRGFNMAEAYSGEIHPFEYYLKK